MRQNVIAEYVASKHPAKVGLLTATDAFGNSAGQVMQAALKQAGLTVVSEKMDPKAIDVTASLLRLQSQGVDYLVYDALGGQVGYVLTGRSKLGWKVPVFAGPGVAVYDLATMVTPSELEGVTLSYLAGSVLGSDIQKRPAFATMYALVKAKSGGHLSGLVVPSSAWDLMQALGLAVKQAGSIETEPVVKALENLNLPAERDLPFTSMHVMRWRSGDHLTQGTKSDYIIMVPGKLVEGIIQPR